MSVKKPYVLLFDFAAPTAIKSAKVTIKLIGHDAQSKPVTISDFANQCQVINHHCTFKIAKEPLGDIYMVVISLDSAEDIKHLTHIKLVCRHQALHFRGYPLDDGHLQFNLFCAHGRLPHQLPAHVNQHINHDLVQRRTFYQKGPKSAQVFDYGHFIERLNDIPHWDTFPVRNRVLENVGLLKDLSANNETKGVNTIEEYREILYQRYGKKLHIATQTWQSDQFFSYQFVAGCNPAHIKYCEQLPIGFEAFEGRKNLYIADYTILAGLNKRIPAPKVLFEDNPHEGLIPLAIQVDSEKDGELFTPNDSPTDWLAAKMWARVADNNIFECCSHYLFAHVVQEQFSIALQRVLPPIHPLYRLMVPFSQNAIAASALGKSVLFDQGQVGDQILAVTGHIAQMFKRSWEQSSLKQRLVLPYDIEKRGVKNLSHYPYKEDGLLIWEALHQYISEVIEVYYPDEQTLKDDPFIQLWLDELNELMPYNDLPKTFSSLEELIEWITGIAFNGSANHAAMNNQMFNCLAFVPGSPHKLDGDFIKEKEKLKYQELIGMLPDSTCTEMTIDTMAFLGNRVIEGVITTDESTLVDFTAHLYHPKVKRCYVQLQKQLADISAQIKKRNQSRTMAYKALLPEHITTSASW